VRGEAYSLAGAKEEVIQISKFVPGKVYLGESASKTNFKALETDISILHLAMHSTLNDEDPELSHLMFSNSEADYEMYISELYGLHFNAELAVLSACNTGVGGFKDGGDLVSMHHAFTTAGIPATVSSLWNAPDQSTKEIMIYFYKNLQRGENKSTVLGFLLFLIKKNSGKSLVIIESFERFSPKTLIESFGEGTRSFAIRYTRFFHNGYLRN